MVTIEKLIDDENCYEVVRSLRWPNGVHCPYCNATKIKKRGHHDHYSYRQRYECRACVQQFDDLSEMIFEGHHQALWVLVICLYFKEELNDGGVLLQLSPSISKTDQGPVMQDLANYFAPIGVRYLGWPKGARTSFSGKLTLL